MKIEDIKNTIIQGDVLEKLKELPGESVDMVITSPPYWGLRNYSVDGQMGLEKTFEEFMNKMMEIMKEVKRVVKKTGTIWINFGDCYGGLPAGNKTISPANQGYDGVFVRKAKQGQGAKNFVYLTDNERMFSGKGNNSRLKQTANQKCMLMMPERFAIRCIDELGLILRNKIKWAKQVLDFKNRRTYGSVMPTSVKDRFNESGEELYFFVKNKKYYFDLNAVRIKNQYLGVVDFRTEQEMYAYLDLHQKQEKKNQFNYRVRDAKRKEGQPQFKANEEEIKNYSPADHRGKNDKTAKNYGLKNYQGKFAGNENAEMFNSPRARTQRKDYKYQDNPDPRGNNEGGSGSFRLVLDEEKRNKSKQSKLREKFDLRPKTGAGSLGYGKEVMDYYKDSDIKGNINGKNLPTVWQIGSEPHNFQKELDVETDHFAIFPQALVEIPILAGSPKGGIILDPFMGSGSTAVMVKKLGRNFIGIELSSKYIEIAQKRLRMQPTPLL